MSEYRDPPSDTIQAIPQSKVHTELSQASTAKEPPLSIAFLYTVLRQGALWSLRIPQPENLAANQWAEMEVRTNKFEKFQKVLKSLEKFKSVQPPQSKSRPILTVSRPFTLHEVRESGWLGYTEPNDGTATKHLRNSLKLFYFNFF